MSETLVRAFPNKPTPLLSYGLPFASSLIKHVDVTFCATRLYVICSGSLARHTPHLEHLERQLGSRLAGTRVGMRSHSLWSEILEVIADARHCEADCIVTLGAGSLTDAAKLVSYVRRV
jgi:alcohol dehydrogenase class IV